MKLRLDKRTLLLVFIFIIGLSILLYPTISSTWNQMLANRLMSRYDETVSEMAPEQINTVLEAAKEYNERMLPKEVPDAFSIRSDVFDIEYEALLNLTGDGLMGYIDIPVINVHSPIYHYTTEETLQKGVGHLFGSSLPIGGEGTHSVLTAHRGLPSNTLFSELDKVVIGDKFYLKICDEVFAYQVDQIEIVEPDQTQGLALFDGKDYVTLVTCTPYGVNTHRILCRGYRVPYEPGEEKVIQRRAWVNMNILTSLVGALTGILIALILVIRFRKRNSEADKSDSKKDKGKKIIHIR